jgi:Uma2 family endonuclease
LKQKVFVAFRVRPQASDARAILSYISRMDARHMTQGAEGFPRLRFTNADVRQLVDAGVMSHKDRVELIRGELVPMAPEFDRHLRARSRIARIFGRALGDEFFVASDGSLFLAEDIEFRPDLHVFRETLKSDEIGGGDVLLAVELSSSTQRKDLQLKAPIYAQYGVRELWVIDLEAKTGLVFDRIEGGAYAQGKPVGPDDVLTPQLIPGVSLRIRDLF